jgi:ABC-2 type transport system ATP-binding protein
MIEIRDVHKNYGETQALRGISFSIQRGEVVGLLGPNGAGKTTALKILVGYLIPTSGRATVAGHDAENDPLSVQEKIGYLPESAPSYHDMLVQEYLSFTAEMRALQGAHKKERIHRVAEDCAIMDVLTRPIGQLSKGYRQRVGLAAAMVHDPEILLLDEPTSGLDPNQIIEVRDLIRRLGANKTIIFSTHILSEVEVSCSRAVMIIDGLVRADGTLDELTRSREQVVRLAVDNPDEAREVLERVPHVATARATALEDGFTTFRLALEEDHEVGEEVAAAVRERGWPLRELRRDDRNLEQLFRELTGTSVKEVSA